MIKQLPYPQYGESYTNETARKLTDGEAAVLIGEFLAERDGYVAHDFHANARVAVNKMLKIVMLERSQFDIGAGNRRRAVRLLRNH